MRRRNLSLSRLYWQQFYLLLHDLGADLQFATYCAYRGRLETAFLAAELASAAAADTRPQSQQGKLQDAADQPAAGAPVTAEGGIRCHVSAVACTGMVLFFSAKLAMAGTESNDCRGA